MSDSGDKFFKGFVFGSIIGGVLGVLFAPKSGRETRDELSDETDKLMERFKMDVENAKKAALKSFDENKDRIISKLVPEEPAHKEPADDEQTDAGEEKQEAKRPRRRRPPRPRAEKDAKSKS